ncbi:site-2 protease family protein [Candidatus Peregrinibacteria bacterium]|nr:MAG: site-2 protease family protein [Candidatus Peregrinibacteria bacterium]
MFLSLHYLLALVLILTVHEASHAWVAMRLGDPTAERAGRISLNPLRHLDVLGTLMLFFVGIGWGKPVPVNPRNFEKPFRDEAFTALAGPAANLILAFAAAIPYSYLPVSFLQFFFGAVLQLSIVLFLFNMLPFPPLDGSKFLTLFVPVRYRATYLDFLDKSTPYFIALVVIDLYLGERIFGVSLVSDLVAWATFWLRTAILVIV